MTEEDIQSRFGFLKPVAYVDYVENGAIGILSKKFGYEVLSEGDELLQKKLVFDWLENFLKNKVGEGFEEWQKGDYDVPEDTFAESYALKKLEEKLTEERGEVFDG